MNHASTLEKSEKPRILVVPLDWGLGHATRCIPVIYELISHGVEVWLAGEDQEILLKKEFPKCRFLSLNGYRVRYGRSGIGFFLTLFIQFPRVLQAIKKEHSWLKKVADAHQFDAIISDNRFGLYHEKIPAVFITHQLIIKSPFGKWSEGLLQKINYRHINRFKECWIPDEENENDLAGQLSHPLILPGIPVHYLGILSRLKKAGNNEIMNHLFISLSGPEPQRTLLEKKIINDIGHYNGTATVVRGLPGEASIIPSTNDIQFYNHLPADEFNKEMGKAEYVISRSGYSTVMDIVTMGKKSILVPTPGQTEQEYLAKYLVQKKIAFCMEQKEFSLQDALKKASIHDYSIRENTSTKKLSLFIRLFLDRLKAAKIL